MRKSVWLIALFITSALTAHTQDYEFYNFVLTEDGSGYTVYPNPDVSYEGELIVPAIRESDGLPLVGVDGFSYNERLLAIRFEEGSQVKYIGSFQGCTGIQVCDLPQSVETLGNYAFNGCTMLSELTLNNNLKNIGISCFEGCTSLESITLPKSLKVIRENAFRCCTGLRSVVFEDGMDLYTNGLYGFYNNVFDGCESLQSVKLPNNTPGVFIIPMATFSWCPSLKSIKFPANTKSIEQMAFYRSGIESLDLTTITSKDVFLEGYYTFAACPNLKTITANGYFQFSTTSLY